MDAIALFAAAAKPAYKTLAEAAKRDS